MAPSKSQIWARNYSRILSISYESSSQIEHNVTKGDSREHQILDTLRNLLPKKYLFENNVVINNSEGFETKKFDGVIYDGDNWPMLLNDNSIVVCPVESVKLVFEIKSDLNSSELEKIFNEAGNLITASKVSGCKPQIAAFAYKCTSLKLMFYDFVTRSLTGEGYPSLICILNVGIFCYLDAEGAISKSPDENCIPIFLRTGDDSLLLFTYLLTEHITELHITSVIKKYSSQLFGNIDYFTFDKSFLKRLEAGENYRKKFEGNYEVDIQEVYDNIIKEF
jgi:hypothetical protein